MTDLKLTPLNPDVPPEVIGEWEDDALENAHLDARYARMLDDELDEDTVDLWLAAVRMAA